MQCFQVGRTIRGLSVVLLAGILVVPGPIHAADTPAAKQPVPRVGGFQRLVAAKKAAAKKVNVPKEKSPEEKAGVKGAVRLPAPLAATEVASQVDQLILADLEQAKLQPAPITSDEDFLRRVTFDLTGTTPAPNEVSLFGLNPDPLKRAKVIDDLLASERYARNWSQYWREVIYSRATDPRSRVAQGQFEEWIRKGAGCEYKLG